MISAVILAAGQSRRMGKPKINLPWGDTTVLGQVITAFITAGIPEIVVVTGSLPVIGLTETMKTKVRFIHNPHSLESGMLVSLQTGIKGMGDETDSVVVALGDQPQIETCVILQLIDVLYRQPDLLVVPSYQMRRGHPWIVKRPLWEALFSLPPDASLRDFLDLHAKHIKYVTVDSETILQDLDTPDDYDRFAPRR